MGRNMVRPGLFARWFRRGDADVLPPELRSGLDSPPFISPLRLAVVTGDTLRCYVGGVCVFDKALTSSEAAYLIEQLARAVR